MRRRRRRSSDDDDDDENDKALKMTQVLISAPPRTGKSQYAMYLIDKFSKEQPNRPIYTNIIGCNYPGVISIKSSLQKPFDWRDLPNGAILFYDECHEHPSFSQDDLLKDFQPDFAKLDAMINLVESERPSVHFYNIIDEYYEHLYEKQHYQGIQLVRPDEKKEAAKIYVQTGKLPAFLKKPLLEYLQNQRKKEAVRQKESILDIGRSLTLHGHFGIDIFMITQNVKRVNDAIKAASSKHLILRRMFGWDMCFIFEYPEVQTYFGSSNRKNATSWRPFIYKRQLYKYYISAEEHHIKKQFPLGIVAMAALPILLFTYLFYDAKQANTLGLFGDEKKEVATKNNASPAPVAAAPNPNNMTLADQLTVQNKIADCVKSGQMTFEQCQVTYDQNFANQRNMELMQSTGNTMQAVVFNFDPAKPYDTTYQANYNPQDFPRFTNAVVYNGKCHAYSQQGTLMNDVSDHDCRRLASGDRPFDYFRQKQQNNINAGLPSQNSTNNNSPVMTAEDIAKYHQAKEMGLI